ncbi:unnamed protein product, partial [Tetraodon nigroviridis]
MLTLDGLEIIAVLVVMGLFIKVLEQFGMFEPVGGEDVSEKEEQNPTTVVLSSISLKLMHFLGLIDLTTAGNPSTSQSKKTIKQRFLKLLPCCNPRLPPQSVKANSVEDDFELSTVCHRPESMDKLQEQTKFTKKELQVLYRGFKNVGSAAACSVMIVALQTFRLMRTELECPSGVVNEENFKTIYSQFFPQGDSSMYAHFLFEAFDTNKNGSVSFEEMLDIMKSIYDMMGKYTYPTMQDDAPREHVENFFQKMDRNKDGVVTIEEFIESCKKDENIMQSMQLFDNVI